VKPGGAAAKGICERMRWRDYPQKSPLAATHFEEFFRLLPARANSKHSWTVERQEIEARDWDLKAVNPHARRQEDLRRPEELLDLIKAKEREVAEAVTTQRKLLA